MVLSIVDTSLFLWLALSYLAAGIGGVYMLLKRAEWTEWYAHLDKAPWTPPNWVFGPVWFILYTLRGVASWLAFRALEHAPSYFAWVMCWVIGLVTLFLNAAWTPAFFGARMIRLALLLLVLTFASAIAHDGLCFSINTVSGALLVPELVWLAYAFSLNVYVVVHNEVSEAKEEPFERL